MKYANSHKYSVNDKRTVIAAHRRIWLLNANSTGPSARLPTNIIVGFQNISVHMLHNNHIEIIRIVADPTCEDWIFHIRNELFSISLKVWNGTEENHTTVKF